MSAAANHSVNVAEHIRLVAEQHAKELDLAAVKELLMDLFDEARRATSLEDLNVAFGIAHGLLGELL